MPHYFLIVYFEKSISRCLEKAAARVGPRALLSPHGGVSAMPLQQIAKTLRHQQLTSEHEIAVSAPATGQVGRTAVPHRAEWLRPGDNVDRILHDHLDIGRVATALVVKRKAPIEAGKFPRLHCWLRPLANCKPMKT